MHGHCCSIAFAYILPGAVQQIPSALQVSVNAIEASAGLDLLNRLPLAVQEELEGGVDSGPTE